MTDPVIVFTASVIAELAARKFLEESVGEVAKEFTAGAIAKMGELWQSIKNKLSGKSPKLDEALGKIEQGDRASIDTVVKNLDVAMDEDDGFAKRVKDWAEAIDAGKIAAVNVENAGVIGVVAPGGNISIGKQVNVSQDGTNNTQTNTFTL
ncbi:MAG: hypothetical protein HC856_06490 [Pseudanabaena sp. RU_4_16]|nr:hypothetical protein [Pseudanabaena sp. RU_4_16]